MQLHELRSPSGSKQKTKRKGRGRSSGLGKTSGRGQKGQKARAGYKLRPGFEGGQMPLVRRIPKRGFTNIFKKQYVVINIDDLSSRFEDGEEVTPEKLKEKGLLKSYKDGIKILGRGEIDKRLTVKAHSYSKNALEKIKAAGGKAEVV